MKIDSTLNIAKSLGIKREKDDDTEVTKAHLKFTDLFITREQVNELACQRPGWCETSFFDELNAPLATWALAMPDLALEVTGQVRGIKGQNLGLSGAELTGIVIEFTGNNGSPGALMSGQLAWLVAGDESADVEPLLGRICTCAWAVVGTGQTKLFHEAA